MVNLANPGGERRHVTVLFCDMVGSTNLARILDPEDLHEITHNYYHCCSSSIHRFDGVVANYIGDGVMALFGYPRAHEDDAERAVHAALTLIRTLETSDAMRTHPVSARIGIATGLVVVGAERSESLTPEKSVVGETPNFAAHLQAAAEPNTIVISTATRRLVGDVFNLTEVELANFKGVGQPVIAWRVVGEKTTSSRFAAHAATLTDFVGREQEIALLSDRWRQVVRGEGQVVLLAGEAGIGKSRIIETFRGLITETHVTVRYQCSPFHGDSALYPVIAQIESSAGITLDDSPSARFKKLDVLLRDVNGRSGRSASIDCRPPLDPYRRSPSLAGSRSATPP